MPNELLIIYSYLHSDILRMQIVMISSMNRNIVYHQRLGFSILTN